jgi:Uncharacterized protein conserved in bacteria (DUF2141)
LGIPLEPYGFSNNVRITFGPPKWEEAKFTVKGSTAEVSIGGEVKKSRRLNHTSRPAQRSSSVPISIELISPSTKSCKTRLSRRSIKS